MITPGRRFVAASYTVALFSAVSIAAGQAAPPPAASPVTPAMTMAMTAAGALTDPAAKLAAYEKFRADFPGSPIADSPILTTLLNSFPDRVADITAVFDRIVARVPVTASPEARLTSILAPVGTVVAKKQLIDRSQELVDEAMAALNFDKYCETQRDLAQRANRQLPQTDALNTQFKSIQSRGTEMQGRLALARADTGKAVNLLKQASEATNTYGAATTLLVDIYSAQNDYNKAVAVLTNAMDAARSPAAKSAPTIALANLYIKKGDDRKAQDLLTDVLKGNPTLKPALLSRAKLADKRGDAKGALADFLVAAAASNMTAADDSSMRVAYKKVHGGSDAGMPAAIDKVYADNFPNPVKPEAYKPTDKRTDRLVLLEMFTGSGCPPCVSADLGFDAAMERYGDAVVPVAYHANIPAPDPMVVSGSDGRREYYKVRGVPTFNIDGALGRLGGGARANTDSTYAAYVRKIDVALETPSKAKITVAASGQGDVITVNANVSNIAADARDLRLHILLVERELHFSGENGVRFHPMVVRAAAGERGAGIPITTAGETRYTFSLDAVRADVINTLKAELEKRAKAVAPGATPREWAADGHAYTAIDTAHLTVVAFVQSGAYIPATLTPAAAAAAAAAVVTADPPVGAAADTTKTTPRAGVAGPNVLQAAKSDVVFGPAKGKGGGH